MEKKMKKEVEEKIRDLITPAVLYEYCTSDWGIKMGLYEKNDGEYSIHFGDSVGNEIDPDERPEAIIQCPGAGNIDTSWFTNEWTTEREDGRYDCNDGKIRTLEECIQSCCEDGDMLDYIDEIEEGCVEQIRENERQKQELEYQSKLA